MCINITHISFFPTGYTDSRRLQREESEAVEDMGLATAHVLVSSLRDHMCSCVFLLPARTDDGAAHTGSSLHSISITVSVQVSQSHLLETVTTM